jgi:hypothetical protein
MPDITTANRGDIVRFKSYALRVEQEPIRQPGRITLTGRISVDGSPIVTRSFIEGKDVRIDRAT